MTETPEVVHVPHHDSRTRRVRGGRRRGDRRHPLASFIERQPGLSDTPEVTVIPAENRLAKDHEAFKAGDAKSGDKFVIKRHVPANK